MKITRTTSALAFVGLFAAAVACGKSTGTGVGDPTGADPTTDVLGGDGLDGGDPASGDGLVLGTGAGGPGALVDAAGGAVIDAGGGLGECKVGTTACTNCVDDDKDGVPDWLDPDCTGPLDNDETSFATGIPGDNVDPCRQDCFFDGNSGAGDDKCLNNLKCDPASPGGEKCPYDPAAKNCTEASPACLNFCKPLVPNGCDCFGCCALPSKSGGTVSVMLTATCSADKADDPTACPRCTMDTACVNTCEKCEYCVGKTTLPAECTTTSTLPQCPAGVRACDANNPCNTGDYCLTGCCAAALR